MLSYFDSHAKKHNRDYFIQLLNIAKADGTISESESTLLHRLGKRLGFTDEEIEHIMANPGQSSYHAPVELAQKFEQFYDVVKMILADGIVTDEERKIASHFAVASGFQESETALLMDVLVTGIRNGVDEDDLFSEYKKKRRVV